ncbi:hypothetical protein NHX12_020816 [Muraenolepis orangiensis]|uniref:Uncharacterized protein n=1 Tax=Muraenolepis orangiensis TaxID=630683 RepID=A0A9Q0EVL2_9TELE|nr:hypothetical protein NHX12_020816 [Muraenolepis orangiensis]
MGAPWQAGSWGEGGGVRPCVLGRGRRREAVCPGEREEARGRVSWGEGGGARPCVLGRGSRREAVCPGEREQARGCVSWGEGAGARLVFWDPGRYPRRALNDSQADLLSL